MRRCRCKEGFAKRLSATGAGGQAPLGLGDLWRGSQHLQGRAHIRERGRRGARSLWSHCILGSDCAVQGAVLLRRKSSLTSFALFSCRPDFTPFISISDLAPSPLPPPLAYHIRVQCYRCFPSPEFASSSELQSTDR